MASTKNVLSRWKRDGAREREKEIHRFRFRLEFQWNENMHLMYLFYVFREDKYNYDINIPRYILARFNHECQVFGMHVGVFHLQMKILLVVKFHSVITNDSLNNWIPLFGKRLGPILHYKQWETGIDELQTIWEMLTLKWRWISVREFLPFSDENPEKRMFVMLLYSLVIRDNRIHIHCCMTIKITK